MIWLNSFSDYNDFHFLGGLVCRGILENFEHNVHTFISLSSPHAGQFGGT